MSHDHRICFVGDSYTAGTADETYLGWTGRVCASAMARSQHKDFALSAYNLGIRRDTSRDIAARWESECAARLQIPGIEPYVVFAFGINDTTHVDRHPRVPLVDTIEQFTAIVQRAKQRYHVIIIGPALMAHDENLEQNDRILTLCEALSERAAELPVPYLPLAERLNQHPDWQLELNQGDGSHPNSAGYARIATMIDQWPAWWFSDNHD